MQSTCDFSVSESVFSNLLSFPPDSIDLLLRHASSLLRDPSCRFALIERNNDQLQLSFSFVLRTPQGKRAIDECSLWKNSQRDGWCEQSYNDAKHNHVLESVFFAAGTEQGGRLCSRMQNGQKSYVLLENGQELTFNQTLNMKATAYTTGDPGVGTITASGTTVRVGTVAVDKSVIPLGTRMFIVTSDGIVYGMAVAEDTGLPRFAASQMAQWLYVKKVRTIDEMTNISRFGRAALAEKYEVGVSGYSMVQESVDGTRKYLFPVGRPGQKDRKPGFLEQSAVEAVMIPDGDRSTLCVSSQSGCRMGCHFCMTGRQGFHGNLSAADIISQFLAVDETDSLTNTVFMGMGEPLDNYDNVSRAIEILTSDWGFGWSPKRITLSTIGVMPVLKKYLDESRCHLAVSLHSPFHEERLSLMPVEKAWPIEEVVDLIRRYDFTGQRRVSFEYTMFAGFNDDKRHADALARLLKGLECRVNLIRFHQIPDFPYTTSPDAVMEAFRDRLNRAGVVTTIRASRGQDIFAACGMLAGKHGKDLGK